MNVLNCGYNLELCCGESLIGEEFVVNYDVDNVGCGVVWDDVGGDLCVCSVGVFCEGRNFVVFYFDYEF